MREDIAPFEKREMDGRPTLRLHGEDDKNRIIVEKDKTHIILDAIIEGWDIDIYYAIIDGDINIKDIAKQHGRYDKRHLTGDAEGHLIIKGNIAICNCEVNYMNFYTVTFNGYTYFYSSTFNNGANFHTVTFNGDVDFNSATFNDDASFTSVTFNGYAGFTSVTFNGFAGFLSTTFNGNASFDSITLNGHAALFTSAIFNGHARFYSATFNGDAEFNDTIFSAIAVFDCSYFNKSVNLAKANLDKVPPESLDSIGDAYVRSSIRGTHYFFQMAGYRYWINGNYNEAANSFRMAKVEYNKEGKYDEAGKMYVMEKKSIKMASPADKKILYQLWETSCNYGESWVRFTLWLLGIIVIFAIVYTQSPWGIIAFNNNPYQLDNNLLDRIHTSLYLSISTFASFGDLEPVNNVGKLAVSLELLFGYLMIGVLITLVTRKMTRN